MIVFMFVYDSLFLLIKWNKIKNKYNLYEILFYCLLNLIMFKGIKRKLYR